MQRFSTSGISGSTPSIETFGDEIVLGYARVSSREQALNSHALEQQIARLEAAGATLVIYDVQTGKKDDRSGLMKALNLIEAGKVAKIVFTRLDRLGRRVPIIHKVVDVLKRCDVRLHVLDQPIGLDDSNGRLMLNIFATIAEMEVEQLGDRVKHGNQHRRNQQLACPCFPFGYTRIDDRYALDHTPALCLLADRPDHYLALYAEEAEPIPGLSFAQLAQDSVDIFLAAKGIGKAIRGIHEKYGIQHYSRKKNGNDKIFHFSQAGLRRFITNPVLCGHTAYLKRRKLPDGRRINLPPEQWQLVRDTHPNDRLISEAQAEQIQEILAYNAAHVGRHLLKRSWEGEDAYAEFTYLRQLVFCAECGVRAISKTRHSKDQQTIYRYYACRHARKGCDNVKGTRKQQIEDELIKFFVQQSHVLTADGQDAEVVLPQRTEKLSQLEAELANSERMQCQSPALEQHKQFLRQQIHDELNPFSQRALERKSAREILQLGNSLAVWNLLSTDEKTRVIPRIVERITVANGQVQSIVLKA